MASRGFMNSEYVYVGTQEETVLENYFVMISKLNFERAKEQCERERETKITGGGGSGSVWCEFMNLLSRLSVAESHYNSLNFIGRSWIVKKEPLTVLYENIIQELKKIREIYQNRKGGTDFSWERKMSELIASIIEYIVARKELINFYLSLDAHDGYHINYLHGNHLLKELKDNHKECFQHAFLKPAKQSFWTEVGVLTDLINAQQSLANWEFLPSLLSLQNGQTKLRAWHGLQPSMIQKVQEYSTPRIASRSYPKSPPTTSNISLLYQWLCTFHNLLLSKFTIYFYKNLLDNNATNYTKMLSHKLYPDYLQNFSFIVKHSPPSSCVCLIFDTNGLENFKGSTYSLPSSPPLTLSGLNSYPIMMSVPQDFDFLAHKANIVSMVMSQGATSPTTGISTQIDSKLHCTYHLAQIDLRVTLVAVIGSLKHRDQESIMSTLIESINNLRLHPILQGLKPEK